MNLVERRWTAMARRSKAPQKSKKKAPRVVYVGYRAAMETLSARWSATPHELAAWVAMGPRGGGLAAYVRANQVPQPRRFTFALLLDRDYLSPLMQSWYRQNELTRFHPKDRYVTGAELIERWKSQAAIEPEAFVRAKTLEGSLTDFHPIYGVTEVSDGPGSDFPKLQEGLFVVSEIEAIERNEFGNVPRARNGSTSWLSANARAAANARHSKPGGAKERHEKICEAWASGKYGSRERCAEEECGALGMSFSAARRALRNTPKPKR